MSRGSRAVLTVEEIERLHRRYVRLVGRFKSAWTFRRFLEGLSRIFVDTAPPESTHDFQRVYSRLKQVGEALSSGPGEEVRDRLAELSSMVDGLTADLVDYDNRVSASLHRGFVQRSGGLDEQVLAGMLRFYLRAQEGRPWNADRLDKADFLASRLAEASGGRGAKPDWDGVEEVFRQLVRSVGRESQLSADELEEVRRVVRETGRRAGELDSIDELRDLVASYRELKHGLDGSFFEPPVLREVVRTNHLLRRAVERVSQREARGIFSGSERLLELEGRVAVDGSLDRELDDVKRDIASFERRVQDRNVRLDELSNLRAQVEELLPRLDVSAPEGGSRVRGVSAGGGGEGRAPGAGRSAEDELLRDDYKLLVGALEKADPDVGPQLAVSLDRLARLDVDPREVVAYRRLVGNEPCDPRLERLVLVAAALRLRLRREVRSLRERGRGGAGWGPALGEARLAVRLGGEYGHRLAHVVEDALLGGDAEELRALETLRMRLLREHAELWLLLAESRREEESG